MSGDVGYEEKKHQDLEKAKWLDLYWEVILEQRQSWNEEADAKTAMGTREPELRASACLTNSEEDRAAAI